MELKDLLPADLLLTAQQLSKHYKKQKYKIGEADVIDNIDYIFHLVCRKNYETIAIEIRKSCSIESFHKSLIEKCQSEHLAIKIYFAVPTKIEDEEISVSLTHRQALQNKNVGLLIVTDNDIIEDIGTVKCNRRISLDPGIRLAEYKKPILDILDKYHRGDCLNALRDLCDVVEGENFKLAIKASKRGLYSIPHLELENRQRDWDYIINTLRGQNIIDNTLRNELISFKEARRLGNHWKTYRDLIRLEEQYQEKTLQGTRVLRDIIRLKNSSTLFPPTASPSS